MFESLDRQYEVAFEAGRREGRRQEHLSICGWCRQGLECPYGKREPKAEKGQTQAGIETKEVSEGAHKG